MFLFLVPVDLDARIKAVLIAAVFLIVSLYTKQSFSSINTEQFLITVTLKHGNTF